jgi:hypothetical protein
MWRRLNLNDFERAHTLMKSPVEYGSWWVCREYEIRGQDIVAKWPRNESSKWWGYMPLEHAPWLFLELAELNEREDFQEAALNFCHKYGIPGDLTSNRNVVERMSLSSLSLSSFQEEVGKIWEVIKIYERALNGDEEVIQGPPPDLGFPGPAGSPDRYVVHGLGWAVALVTERVQRLCRPTLYFTPKSIRPETIVAGIKNTWEFDNLLGAAYLQMWWLLTSSGDVARCEYCRRIMSLARPSPAGRKRRRDRRFCSDSCRQAHHRKKRAEDVPW